jgi:hypothetical protein
MKALNAGDSSTSTPGQWRVLNDGAIGDLQVAGGPGIEQAGDTDLRLRVESQRIEGVGVHPAPDRIDPARSSDGAHQQAIVLYGQVAPFDQRQAEVARQVRLLGISLVEPARRQQRNAWALAAAVGGDAFAQAGEEIGQTAHLVVGQQRVGGARHGEPVLQRVADARRQAHLVVQHAPLSRRPARKVGGVDVDEVPAFGPLPQHAAREVRAAGDDRGGQMPLGDDALGAVDVSGEMLEQVRALHQPALDVRPLTGADDQRQRRDRPSALRLVTGDAEGEAEVVDVPRCGLGEHGGVALSHRRKAGRHRVPLGGDLGRGASVKVARGTGDRVAVQPVAGSR